MPRVGRARASKGDRLAAYLRGWVLRGLGDFIAALGGDARHYEQRFALPLSHAVPGELTVPGLSMFRLLEACAQELDCPDFGIRLGFAQGRAPIGPVMAGAQSATVGEMLAAAMPYLNLLSPALATELQPMPAGPRMSYLIRVPRAGATRQFEQWCVAINLKALQEVAGSGIRLRSAFFTHAPLLSLRDYTRHFGCPVHFAQSAFGVEYFAADMARPTRENNAEMKALAAGYIDKIALPPDLGLEEQIDALIRKLLPAGRCSIEAIARQQGMSVRTLQRRLADVGLVFDKLVDDVRRDRCVVVLRDRALRMAQVAQLLGYAEQGSFTHAFRRWYGMTPSAWRRNQ